jgi:hypothetical protein
METTVKLLRDTVDALVALKMDLQCTDVLPDERLVMSSDRARRACDDIDRSIDRIRRAMTKLADGQQPEGD